MVVQHRCPDCAKHDSLMIRLKISESGYLVCQRCNWIGYIENEKLVAGFRPEEYYKK